jgi:hypothetical protein
MSTKISITTKSLMIGTAGCIDLLQILFDFIFPGSDIIITGFGKFIFFIWFRMYGMNVFNKKTLMFDIVEFVPIIGALPATTVWMIRRLAVVEAEELALKAKNFQNPTTQNPQQTESDPNTEFLSQKDRERRFSK